MLLSCVGAGCGSVEVEVGCEPLSLSPVGAAALSVEVGWG